MVVVVGVGAVAHPTFRSNSLGSAGGGGRGGGGVLSRMESLRVSNLRSIRLASKHEKLDVFWDGTFADLAKLFTDGA